MQSPAVKTPAPSKRVGGAATKSSGKKLVQARLPFKIIPSGIATAATGSIVAFKQTDESTKDGRKRKLSFDSELKDSDESDSDDLRERSASKENLTVSAKKKKIGDDADDIILLDDDDIAEDEQEEEKIAEKVVKIDIKNNVDHAPLNKTKLKATKGSSRVSSPHTSKHKEVDEKNTETPRSKVVKDKNTETPKSTELKEEKTVTPKSKEMKGKKPETPKSKKAVGKNTDTPKAMNSPHTPKTKVVKGNPANTSTSKESSKKKTDTPNCTKPKKANTPGSAKNKSIDAKASSATKVQIKLPLGSAKINKRRKSKISVDSADAEIIVSSDENDSNPVKRPKVEEISKEYKNNGDADKAVILNTYKISSTSLDDSSNTESEENSNVLVLEIGGNETDVPDSELDSRCSSITVVSKDIASKRTSPTKDIHTIADKTKDTNSPTQQDAIAKNIETTPLKGKLETQNTNEQETKSKEVVLVPENKDNPNTANNTTCVKNKVLEKSEATENNDNKDETADIPVMINSSSDSDSSSVHYESKSNAEQSTPKIIGTPKSIKEDPNKSLKKALTPKQIKLLEQRRKAREEKERKLQEEKLQKQREKEAKELERKREREEREEQRRKEREERDEQKRKEREERDETKRKEREERERKRLAEQEAKNEEKRKRNEAKEEELRKKEDERKRKEDADLKAKKEAEAFQKFFKTKRTSNADSDTAQLQANRNEDYDSKTLAFRPFEVKGDMKMAPICRKQMSLERREQLDACVGANGEKLPENEDLYLAELKCGKITPGMWRRISVDTKVSDDDVQIIDDDLDRAGQAIVEEIHAPIEHFRAKFYKFHENRRPPYYGTWRKRTNVIRPKRPFVQDTKFFDYEVDSDLEWEEEEPGESLDGSDDEKEKESEDDDYEVDNEWFVPHGHLSEEELQNEDDDANTREAQKAKLQVLQQEFAQEMKKKTEKIKPRLIGCIWTDENGNQPALCPKIIWDTLNNRAMLCEAPPLLEDPEVPEKTELGSPTTNGNEKTVEKVKPIKITDAMLNDLVRLVHGNHHSKNFLIKEFIAYLEASEESIKNGEARGPIKSLVREKIEDFAEWTITESTKVSKNNKKKNKKHLCWVVSADVLKRMGLESLDLHNSWKYTLQPKLGTDGTTKPEVEANAETNTHTKMPQISGSDEMKKESESVPKAKTAKDKNVNSQQKGKNLKTNTEITKFTKVLPAKTNTQKSPSMPPLATKASKSLTDEGKLSVATVTIAEPSEKAKKRVPLLMSVARGQQISQPTKNALISEFLKKNSADKVEDRNKRASDAQTSYSTVEGSEGMEID